MYEQDQQNKRTAMTANAPTGLERILSNPTMFKKYMESQTGAANVRAESALRKEWAENPSIQMKYPTPEAYVAANSGAEQAGANPQLKVIGSRPAP
jgi:hypothetical protein